MKPSKSTLSFLFLAALLSITLSGAAFSQTPTVRFEQAPWNPHYELLFAAGAQVVTPDLISNSTFHDRASDNFSFANDERITEVRFDGLYLNFADTNPSLTSTNTVNWVLTIRADNDGQPGTFLRQETRPASEVPTLRTQDVEVGPYEPTGTNTPQMSTIRVRTFSFSLKNAFLVSADTTYWISVQSLSPQLEPAFWMSATGSASGPIPQRSFASKHQYDGYHQKGYGDVAYNLALTLLTIPDNDSDSDGMDDDWETTHGLDPSLDDSAEDPDGDGLTNLREFEAQSDPREADTDGDGLADGVETNTGTYVSEADTGTSPILADSDHDGFIDSVEVPTLPFIDSSQPGTDPNRNDTDGDHYDDALESAQGFDPTDPASHPALISLGTGSGALLGNDLTEGIAPSAITTNVPSQDSPVELFDNGFGSSTSDWLSPTPDLDPTWVTIDLGSPISLTHFTIASSRSNPDRDPYFWELQGSVDGETFETIFHHSNRETQVWTERNQVLQFTAGIHFKPPAAYSIYRLVLEEGGLDGRDIFQLGEIELFGNEATITVTNTDDSGPGSLRQAIADCPENGIINFDPSLSGGTISLGDEPLLIDRSIAIDGSALDEGLTIEARSPELPAAFVINPGFVASLDSLRIVHASSSASNNISSYRIGIDNEGILNLNRISILGIGSCAPNIHNRGTLAAHNSTFSNEGTSRCFGGIGPGLHLAARQLINYGTSTLNGCTLSHFHEQGRSIDNIGDLTISQSTVSGTTVNQRGVLRIANSIFTSTTISPVQRFDGSVEIMGTNLISNLNHSDLTEGPGIIVADPRLALLGDYGGPTPTMPLMPGSPAIDVHDEPQDVTTDQRGFPRLVGSDYDLGAVEYQGDDDFARVFHVDNDGDRNSFGVEQALGTDPFTADPENPRNLTVPTFTPEGQAVLTFHIATDAHPDTAWILERSTDLLTFSEIYRFDGSTAVHGTGIASERDGDRLTLNDQTPPTGGAFYRFRARLRAPD